MMAKKGLSQFKALASPPSIFVSYFSSTSQLHSSLDRKLDKFPVTVWWDLMSCPVPEGVDHSKFWGAIVGAVRASGMAGPIQISGYANVFSRFKRNWDYLFAHDITVTHVPNGGSLSMYKTILADLMFWVEWNPPPAHLFLISNNHNFASTLRDLRIWKYNILLASNEVPGVLCSDASIVWRWNDLVKEGNLIGNHFNEPPHASIYGHYNGPLKEVQGRKAEVPKVYTFECFVKVNQSMKLSFEVVAEVEKFKRLVNLLKVGEDLKDSSKILIFASNSQECEKVAKNLRKIHPTARAIHLGTKKAKRDEVLAEFEIGYCRIITTTAVAAQSLDVKHVNHVINYDCPMDLKDYNIRIGCVDAKGTAHTFFRGADLANSAFARELLKSML